MGCPAVVSLEQLPAHRLSCDFAPVACGNFRCEYHPEAGTETREDFLIDGVDYSVLSEDIASSNNATNAEGGDGGGGGSGGSSGSSGGSEGPEAALKTLTAAVAVRSMRQRIAENNRTAAVATSLQLPPCSAAAAATRSARCVFDVVLVLALYFFHLPRRCRGRRGCCGRTRVGTTRSASGGRCPPAATHSVGSATLSSGLPWDYATCACHSWPGRPPPPLPPCLARSSAAASRSPSPPQAAARRRRRRRRRGS